MKYTKSLHSLRPYWHFKIIMYPLKGLSDNKNSVTAERTLLMEETIIGMHQMKEHKYGGVHSVSITEDMKEAKR